MGIPPRRAGRSKGASVGRKSVRTQPSFRPLAATVVGFERDHLPSAAIDALAAHAVAIHQAWRLHLERLSFTAGEREALSGLALAPLLPQIRTGGLDLYTQALERAGQELARRGIPENRAMAALAAQVESALPHVLAEAAAELAVLVRIAFAGSVALTAGYSNARASSWRRFGEQERMRLSRDLHDEIGHHLIVLKLYLGMISSELAKARPARIPEKVEEATGLVSQAIQSVRRLILDLGPVALDGVGFLPAVKLYARQFGTRTGVKVHVRDRGLPGPLPRGHETALYRLLQGALSNVLKHAQARGVKVTVGASNSVIAMVIEDDGVGFDTSVPRQAFGLAAMRDRVTGLGGRFRVESRPAASGAGWHGTRIEVELPVESAANR
jgi:signal transduction histidine kinase